MKVVGRKLLDREVSIDLRDVDDIVITEANGREIVLSLYRIRVEGKIEMRANDGVLIVYPRAANVVELKSER